MWGVVMQTEDLTKNIFALQSGRHVVKIKLHKLPRKTTPGYDATKREKTRGGEHFYKPLWFCGAFSPV